MPLSFKDLQGVKGNPSAEVAPNRRLKINPGQNYVYDLPKELIVRVQSEFPLATLLEQAEPLEELGGKFMALLIREADSETYRDRTADMIEQVAKQTGIYFPHVFERYLELGILSLRPRDAWTVTEATRRTLKICSYNCSLAQVLAGKGFTQCAGFCTAAAQAAAGKIGLTVEVSCVRKDQGVCELSFRPQ